MNETIIQQLVEFLNNASPVVWEAARRQAMVSCLTNGMWAIVSMAFMYISYRVIMNGVRMYKDDDEFDGIWLISLGSMVFFTCFLIAMFSLHWTIGTLLNPDYCAIRLLINLIPQ